MTFDQLFELQAGQPRDQQMPADPKAFRDPMHPKAPTRLENMFYPGNIPPETVGYMDGGMQGVQKQMQERNMIPPEQLLAEMLRREKRRRMRQPSPFLLSGTGETSSGMKQLMSGAGYQSPLLTEV